MTCDYLTKMSIIKIVATGIQPKTFWCIAIFITNQIEWRGLVQYILFSSTLCIVYHTKISSVLVNLSSQYFTSKIRLVLYTVMKNCCYRICTFFSYQNHCIDETLQKCSCLHWFFMSFWYVVYLIMFKLLMHCLNTLKSHCDVNDVSNASYLLWLTSCCKWVSLVYSLPAIMYIIDY